MTRSTIALAALASLGSLLLFAGPAAAVPGAPAPGLTSGSQVEAVAYRGRRYRRTPQRVMGLVPGPDRRRGRRGRLLPR